MGMVQSRRQSTTNTKIALEIHERKRRAIATRFEPYLNNEKYCSRCKKLRLTLYFHLHKDKYDGLFCWCKFCTSEIRKRAYQEIRNDPIRYRQRLDKTNEQRKRRREKRDKRELYDLVSRMHWGINYLRTHSKMRLDEVAAILGVSDNTLRYWKVNRLQHAKKEILVAQNRLTTYLDAEKDLTLEGLSHIPILVCMRADMIQTRYTFVQDYKHAQDARDKKVREKVLRRARLHLS